MSSEKKKVHQTNPYQLAMYVYEIEDGQFRELTYGRADSQCDAVPALLDQVDDVPVVEGVDVHVVHCQDSVPNL